MSSSIFDFLREALNTAVEKRKSDESPLDLPCWNKAKETFMADVDSVDSEGKL